MAYKTILVHLNDKRRAARVAGAAAELAGRLQAHLVGLSIAPPVRVLPTGMPGIPDTLAIDDRAQAYRGDNPELKAAFDAAVEGRGITSEWHAEDAGTATIADVALRYASGADLIVAAQREAHGLDPGLDIPDRLAVESARPVLVIPNAGLHAGFGTTVLVAWNGRREATRAAYDALPLLQRALTVKVLSLDAPSEDEAPGGFASSHLCAALARHGVTCEVMEGTSDGNAGRTLLSRAIEERADLVVMGCYGHSRLRELVLGGATRYVLAHMTLPVLMSH